jgi:hypothetical protein
MWLFINDIPVCSCRVTSGVTLGNFLIVVPCGELLMCLSADCQGNRSYDSCDVTIVGYRGKSVYPVVASTPIWVTCGRFLWKAPTLC